MKGTPGMVAIVLDQLTQCELAAMALHPVLRCTHITVAYRPTPDVYNKYRHLIGQEVEFNISAVIFDKESQVATVGGVEVESGCPHITISHAEGITSACSKELIANPSADGNVKLRNMRGRGRYEFRNL